jgi:hypothetical protein
MSAVESAGLVPVVTGAGSGKGPVQSLTLAMAASHVSDGI